MKTKYLAYAQACAICKDYQCLRGEAFDATHKIDFVSVGPYSRILQWQFAKNLLKGLSGTTMLDEDLSGRFDVIVISKSEMEPGFVVKDLRSYLKEREITFDPAPYQCLRNRDISLVTLKQLLS